MNDNTLSPPAQSIFAADVEWQHETCRNGRQLITAVNHANDRAVYADLGDLDEALSDRLVVGDVANELREGGFLAGRKGVIGDGDPARRRPGDGIVWPGADRFVRATHRGGLQLLFQRRWIVAQIAFATLGALGFIALILRGGMQLRAEPGQIPAIVALGLVAVGIHEFGHAIATVHYGRSVRRAGMRLHLAAPTFYVDSVDALLLTRRQRIVQAASGPWAEWLATSLAIFVLVAVPDGSAAASVLHRFIIINTIGIAINLIPCVGLDGALLLGDFIREPDLSTRVRHALRSTDGRRDRWLVVYAIVNSCVAALLLTSSMFFWWELFGELIERLWSHVIGIVLLAAIGLGLVRQVAGTLGSTYPELHVWWDRASSRAAFRTERRWRVQAINAFRVVPGVDQLDAGDLGIIAGRLEQMPASHPGWGGAGHVWVRRARRSRTAAIPIGHDRVVPACEASSSTIRRAVLLPDDWHTYLPQFDSAQPVFSNRSAASLMVTT